MMQLHSTYKNDAICSLIKCTDKNNTHTVDSLRQT